MQRETLGFTRLFTLFCLIIVMAIPLVSGCRLIDVGGDDNNTPATISTISGRVVKSVTPVAAQRGGDRPALLAADIAGAVGIVGAEVWLEDLAADPRFKTTTNASGTYLFTDVPTGEHRVIIKYTDPITGKTMKTRSAGLQVTDTPTLVEAPDLFGEPALNVVTGILRDAEGNFLPEGTVLTLWGETFTVGKDGAFTSPALPESITEAEIFVQLPGENNTTRFTAPFVSGVVPAYVELKIGADKNGNHAPTVVVSASVSGKSVSKVNPGAMVTLVAVGSDADSGDQATLVPTWSVTSGTLGDGASAFEKRWTAPNYFTVATLTVEVKDSKNATGKVQLPILVGIDNPSQVDTGRPTVALTADTETVTDSAAFNVTITFNEPVTDFEQTDISLANGSLSDFTTHTAGRIFKVKVTPQAAGEVQVSIAENVAVDLSNNNNTASNIITVTNSITPAKSSEKAITAFSFPALSVNGTINSANKTIAVTVPFDTNVSALVANFTASAKATVKVGDTPQESGTTANNFSSAVIYKVTAEDGSTAEYTVTVTVTQPTQITALDLSSLVTAPVRGAAPVTTAINQTQYTSAAISWFEADGTTAVAGNFAAAKVYVAKLTLSAKAGYTLTGVAENSFTYTGPTSVTNAANSGAVTIIFAATADAVVDALDLSSLVTAPVKGAAPVTTAINQTQYTSAAISWFEADGTTAVAGNFAAAKVYVAKLTLSAKAGYTLTGVAENSFTYTGSTSVANAANSGAVTITFAATADAVVDALDLSSLVTAPVRGAAPVTTAINQTQYTSAAIGWFEADGTTAVAGNFAAAKVYVAKLTLSAKAGYTLTGVAENSFTYTGATSVANAVNSGAVTITFAATAAEPVTAIAAISGTPQSGQTLTAGALTPVDATVDYQWQVSDDGSSGWSNISGETANTYVINHTKTAVGKYVRVTATGKDSYSGTVNSAPVEVLSAVVTVVSVPAGSFQWDSNAANISTVSAFRMAQHEVTRTQFSTIMGVDPTNTSGSSGVTDPVQTTNWYHAIAFCNKLSLAEGLTPVYAVTGVDFSTLTFAAIPTTPNATWNAATCNWSANGYRLPTEMEWMWAAMGADQDSQPGAMSGGVNVTGYAKIFAGYNGSNSIDAYAWYSSNSSSKTHPAGTKLANELGLYDMSGNIAEWCWDWYSDDGTWPNYAISGAQTDYRGAETGFERVIRGGSWSSPTNYASVYDRYAYSPDYLNSTFGFRVVRP